MTYRQAFSALAVMVSLAAAAPVGCCCIIPIPASVPAPADDGMTELDDAPKAEDASPC